MTETNLKQQIMWYIHIQFLLAVMLLEANSELHTKDSMSYCFSCWTQEVMKNLLLKSFIFGNLSEERLQQKLDWGMKVKKYLSCKHTNFRIRSYTLLMKNSGQYQSKVTQNLYKKMIWLNGHQRCEMFAHEMNLNFSK